MQGRKSTALIITILLLSALIPLSLLPKVNAGTTFTAKATMIQNWKNLCDAHPTVASYESVGSYYETGPLYVFKIGNPSGGVLLFDAAMHGWEDIGTEIEYLWANWLLTNDTDASNRILENNYVLFIPIVTWGGWYDGSPERGNANLTSGKTYGVDINRNFVTGFSYISPPGTPDYPSHGSHGADQNESIAVRYVLDTFAPEIYVTCHYGGGPWLNSYGTNTTLSSWIKTRIGEISTGYGFSCPWSLGSASVGGGMAVGDGNAFGANSWMWEIAADGGSPYHTGSGTDTYMHNCQTMTDIQNWYFPRSLPVLQAMAEAVEIEGDYQYLTMETVVNGEVSPAVGEHAIAEGANQTLIATADGDYQFAAWEIDGSNQTTTYSTWFVVMDANHTAKAYFDPVTSVTVTITAPANTTYPSSTVSVQFSASGGTIDVLWWNCKNGTDWIYGSNQTYTTPTSMTDFVNGTSYTFYAWANNTLAMTGETTVMFTVQIITGEGWTGTLMGVTSTAISSIGGVPKGSISKVGGVP